METVRDIIHLTDTWKTGKQTVVESIIQARDGSILQGSRVTVVLVVGGGGKSGL